MNTKYIFYGVIIILIFIIYYFRDNIKEYLFGKKENEKMENNDEISNLISQLNSEDTDTEEEDTIVKKECIYFNIVISPKENEEIFLGQIIIELFNDICPRTCENFKSLARIEYKNCVIHRIVPGFMFQTGDYENGDGTGGKSIHGEKFSDENFNIKHNKKGIVSMANSGPNTNGSQFFITFKEAPFLDGKHVAFGQVIEGLDVVDKIEKLPVKENEEPEYLVYIRDSGIVVKDFHK